MVNLVNKVINNRYRITQKIADGGMSTVWLAKDISDNHIYAVKILKKDVTSNRIEDIIRFRNEAITVSKLSESEPSLAKIYEVGEDKGIQYIVMEFLKGSSLQELLNNNREFTIDESVEIIYRISSALKYIHSSGILHRDIKPGNLIIDEEKDYPEVKLIDFGVSQLREFDIKDTKEIVGTLYYMSPEQMGIINRIVDERSDLYSLGVIFYQLLTCKLPFSGENLNTIIHQHVTRIPDSPTKLNSKIPVVLEEIVLKLLEKEPENRYQSTVGLLVDLEKFRSGIVDFILGQNDKIKLNYRTNIIGREEELKRLIEMFEGSIKGRGNILTISGEAGKGKTRLVEEFRNYVYEKGGIFAAGKCFASENKVPYGLFSDVINSYLKTFIKYDDNKKTGIKQIIKKSVGELGKIILKLNSKAEEFLESCPELVELEPDSESKRFRMVVSQFFCQLGYANKGFVIFLDDVQWIDEGSLNILMDILNQIGKYSVFVICTYRDNEINDNHILRKFLQGIGNDDKPIQEIRLKSFDKERMKNLIAHLLFNDVDNIGEISEFILKKSKGNPFFSIEILKQMVNENALTYEKGKWHINRNTLSNIQVPSTIVDIIIKRILNLNEEQREILSYAAIIGKKFDVEFLFQLTDRSKEKVIEIIDYAIREQFLEQGHNEYGKILFVHDRVNEAFLKNIGPQKKKELHYKIANILADNNSYNIERVVFNLAYHYIESGDSVKALQYVYPAALKAKEDDANEEAVKYFLLAAKYMEEIGEKGSDKWIECIKSAGNISIYIGKTSEAQELFQKLLPFSQDPVVKAEIYNSIGMALFKSSEYERAIEYTENSLIFLQEKIPGIKIAVILGILKELIIFVLCERFNYTFSGNRKHYDQMVENKLKVSILRNLSWIYLITDTLKYIYIKIRIANLCRYKIGLSRELVGSIADIGFILGVSRIFNLSLKYFEKAYKHAQEFDNQVSYCEVNLPWGYILQWKGDYEKSCEKLREVVNTQKNIGACVELVASYNAYITSLMFCEKHDEAKNCINDYSNYAQRIGGLYAPSISLYLSSNYYLKNGDIEKALFFALESHKTAAGKEIFLECLICIILARIYLIKGEMEKSMELIENAKKLNETNRFLNMYTNHLYIVLADLHISKYTNMKTNMTKEENTIYRKKMKETCRVALAKNKNLPNFSGYSLRVYARYYALIGKYNEAEKFYFRSIEICNKYKLKYELALGYYEYGLFLQSINKYDKARNYVEKAYNIFEEISSVFYMKCCEDFLGISKKSTLDSTERFSQGIRSSQRMSSIVLLSQKISSILDLDQLLDKIMESVLEVTGAQNAYLMMTDKKTGDIKSVISKSVDGSAVQAMNISQNIIREVLEKGEAVISTNAMEDERYSSLQSVVLNSLKSVLCVPIKFNDEIKGICYLDNQLSSSVFSEEDVQILNVFMTQVAISIENAELYRMAITDGLTDLITHKHFHSVLNKELERSRRYGRSFSLFMLDIDNFKKFNDSYGHQAGDQVLINVARVLKENLRNIDSVARYGGEEFAVILPETGLAGAKISAERLRHAIENMKVVYDGIELKVTVSIGISVFPENAADASALINTADKALYKSKETGKNRVTVLGD